MNNQDAVALANRDFATTITFKESAIEAMKTQQRNAQAERDAREAAKAAEASREAEEMGKTFAAQFGFKCETAIFINRTGYGEFIPAILLPETDDKFLTLTNNGWQALNVYKDGTASFADGTESARTIADFAEFYEL